MRKMLLRPWFIAISTIALTHQVLQKVFNFNILVIDSYLDPFLFMPILLHFILMERRYIFGKGASYCLSWYQILTVILFVSIVCELLFPRWSAEFTADYIDVIVYFIGGIVFGVFWNVPNSKKVAT